MAQIKVSGSWKIPSQIHARVSGTWRRMHMCYVRVLGVWKLSWQEEVVVNVTGNSPVLKSLFALADWNNELVVKRAVIATGVTIGATNSYALATTVTADGQSGSFAGTLILDNHGTISGRGGTANSGVGGNAILSNFPGKSGQKMIINNYGTIRAGGGGGGKGGTGGGGKIEDYKPTAWRYSSMAQPYYYWVKVSSSTATLIWDGGQLASNVTATTSYTTGGYVYERGSYRENQGYEYYEIRRRNTTPVVTNTNGGAGGNGGRGQGFNHASATGANGAAGGTNAGAGGKGGNGGGWGASGGTGAKGANGNRTNGTAGAAGGLAGFYITTGANVTLNNSGTVQGRLG